MDIRETGGVMLTKRLSVSVSNRATTIGMVAVIAAFVGSSLVRAQNGQGAGSVAQTPQPGTAEAGRGAAAANQAPTVVSPEILQDRRVTFRLYAPGATEVALGGGIGRGGPPMAKNAAGVWETTVGPMAPGAYRYAFKVHGATVLDPNDQAVTESTTAIRSLLVVPGSEWMDTKNVPHGAVAQVSYDSTVLGRQRRLHVYTPPGYDP